ncbi:BatD family protein [Rhizobium sp. L80/93]|uniref:BatD family protein n=1 Tax=unclassified Rhizobium TaxID=2613769 RepID=UPI001ADA5999|nr:MULTISPECIES: BatD family protein [unclassified Rhizobium]MBO9170733.1 BatD family protein [Rhizobium sp. L245/93]MBO9186556.1 BatD family protein [Rhizobium sp. E27B/91]QYA04395.1 BatD family protein [Rhizobium sp. B21/90]
MKWMVLALLLLTAGRSLAAEPFARVEIEDKGKIVAGQQVRLDVTIFAPDFFTSPPQFPLFDLPNAVVTLPDERAQNIVETVDGIQYSGIRRIYAVVPEVAGSFSLPDVVIALGYSVEGKSVKGEARLPPFGFTVMAGEVTSGNTLTFAARNLALTQSFDRDPAALKVGDALVRTIMVFAEDTQAMMIPSIDVGNSTGMKQYAATSRVDDNVSVGRKPGSRRIQTITYTMEAVGSFTIPGVSYAWYDVDQHRQSTATLPSTKVIAATASLPAEGIAPALQVDADGRFVWRDRTLATVVVILLTLALGWATWHLRNWLSMRSTRWRLAYRNSDRQALRSLQETIRNGEPGDIEAGLRQWSRQKGFRSLADWTAANSQLQNQVENLQRLIYSDGADGVVIDREALVKSVSASVRPTVSPRSGRSYLPALNPRG